MPGYLRTQSSIRFENLVIVLDQDLRVVAASRSFYLTFKVNADETHGKLCMTSETVNGIFRSFVCCLEKSFPSRGP